MPCFSKMLTVFGILITLAAAGLLAQIDSAAYHGAEQFFPGSGLWVCLALVAAELFALIWMYRALFLRNGKLVLRPEATEEERRAFFVEMERRLMTNPLIRASGLRVTEPDFMEKALALLDGKADEEIRSCGRKVFIGTALSQNGKLDALIMFFSLARTVWRVSAIYNQRPTPREIISVYSTVSSATFVAFSIEALNIPQTITDSLSELVPSVAPAMAASSVPFVGSAMHVFTSSVIDGASNCLLAVRAGVITRRAYRYAIYGGEENLRRSSVRETAAMLGQISNEAVGAIVKALKTELQELSLSGGRKVADGASRVVDGVKNTVTGAAAGVASAATGTAQAVGNGGRAAVEAVVHGARKVGETAADGAAAVGSTVSAAGSAVAGGVHTAGRALKHTGRSIKEGAVAGVHSAADHLRYGVHAVGKSVGAAAGKVGHGLGRLVPLRLRARFGPRDT